MARRLAVLTVALVLLAAPAWAAGGASSWALTQIRVVVAHGLMARSVKTFRPDAPLTRGGLASLSAALGDQKVSATPPADASAPVTMTGLDAGLVHALGLSDSAYRFNLGARAAGLRPPTRFGSEVVARLLELRTNHPAGQDDLELLPADPATRAEAAYSAAQVLGFSGWEVQGAQQESLDFALPLLTPWQKRVLQTAVNFIGYPYVWGGESETTSSPFGAQAQGGFDCSGFVWRVYKLQAYPGGTALAGTLRGRTTYQMSGEVGRAKRIPLAKLQPADVVFFGATGPRSKPAQVNHMGIYLGNGWFIHSSEQGVYLSTMTGWYRTRFAWGRRPLAEAGLIGSS
jgi:cell wall-associated NlpC family hydrolase